MRILIGYFVDGKHSGIDKYLLNFINTIKSEDIYIDILTIIRYNTIYINRK